MTRLTTAFILALTTAAPAGAASPPDASAPRVERPVPRIVVRQPVVLCAPDEAFQGGFTQGFEAEIDRGAGERRAEPGRRAGLPAPRLVAAAPR